jgi:hypothetical protein
VSDLTRDWLSVNMLKENRAEPGVVRMSHAASSAPTVSASLTVCRVMSPKWKDSDREA